MKSGRHGELTKLIWSVCEMYAPQPRGVVERYTATARLFHWLTALLVVVAYVVSVGGWDTHGGEKATHDALLAELDAAVTGFVNAMVADPRGRRHR